VILGVAVGVNLTRPRGIATGLATCAWLIAATVTPVIAHGEVTLQLGAEQIQPGGSIEVRGDLGTGEVFEVALVARADGSRRVVGTISAIEEGHFQSYVTFPADVATGDYLVEVSVDLTVARAPLTIAGVPIMPGGEPPSRDEPLGQPMPSGPGHAADNDPNVSTAGAPARPERSLIQGVAVLLIAGILGVGLLTLLRLAGLRRSAP
jgi:hypothetical protein